MSFIDLYAEEVDTPVLKVNHKSLTDVSPGDEIIDGSIDTDEEDYPSAKIIPIENIDSSEDEEESETDQICLKNQCSLQNMYGCKDPSGFFLLDNLFSELTDEYQRTLARENLGIGDVYTLSWGNIKGNLSNQTDLYTFVTSQVDTNINALIDELNLKLSQWAYDISTSLSLKANITSPNFLGVPTTSLPELTDDSGRLASTEWVNSRIRNIQTAYNLEAINVNPESNYYGDDPVDVVVTWTYVQNVSAQSINGVSLDVGLRRYVFEQVSTSKTITLNYTYGDKTESRTVFFTKQYPIYYGTSSNYTQLSKTSDLSFTVNAASGSYIYVFIPNDATLELAVNSIIGGFTLYGTQIINSNKYYIYKSAIAGLGSTKIQVI